MSYIRKFFGLNTLAIIAGGGLLFSVSSAEAVPVSFTQITTNGATGGAAQLSVDVTDSGLGGALFSFSVVAGTNLVMNVAQIYFDDRTPLFLAPMTDANIITQIGVDFSGGSASPGHLPGGGAVNFQTTVGLLADSAPGNVSPGNKSGLEIGDSLVIGLDYQTGIDFADLFASLNDGSFRIGMHVRSHFAGGSESYVSTPAGGGVIFDPVPLPAGLPLLLSALGITALLRRKSRKAA